jgi:hypothetical protein
VTPILSSHKRFQSTTGLESLDQSNSAAAAARTFAAHSLKPRPLHSSPCSLECLLDKPPLGSNRRTPGLASLRNRPPSARPVLQPRPLGLQPHSLHLLRPLLSAFLPHPPRLLGSPSVALEEAAMLEAESSITRLP